MVVNDGWNGSYMGAILVFNNKHADWDCMACTNMVIIFIITNNTTPLFRCK